MPSIFTKIINKEIPAFIIAETETLIAFLDVFPLAKGHVLVVPKKEIDYIFSVEDTLLAEMTLFSKKIALAIEKAIPCKRVGVAVIGLEVPHAHIHLIPLQTVQDINFTREKLKLPAEEMNEIAEAIKKQL
ncbi:HIT family protein [Cytophaga hutchinsonii]|jgi:histidine triad (HIT) family protein|uniref:HIT family protein n=1 Tax=Cytophaga hutchinsonii (strain ATCC 33406 / DSM 1761 / CIP 103989 / NBRC 15051 / NCIMB 9469 / D465) TaxID=269798 RepID=A0A6N4SRG8_CYTH3|nr:HIT family protein [Cytophaga hutchinsonii]ABG58901.1 HIT family protein [Cytophaga hutchinsonii ATCC 33406]SFX81678.1 histidine triad (HIT) family protein [Cytophaga hutchinsonii ATCC 33406]